MENQTVVEELTGAIELVNDFEEERTVFDIVNAAGVVAEESIKTMFGFIVDGKKVSWDTKIGPNQKLTIIPEFGGGM